VSAWRPRDRQFQPNFDRAGFRCNQEVQSHDVAFRVMQNKIDVIERNEMREPLGQILKQLAEIAVRRDGLRHLE
jgi:hypothetical protein